MPAPLEEPRSAAFRPPSAPPWTEVRLPLSSKIFVGHLLTVVGTMALVFLLGHEALMGLESRWVLLLSVLLPASTMAWLISRRLTRNLHSLSRAAHAISTGDLSERLTPNGMTTWPDEIDLLTHATAGMLENLRDLVDHLQTSAASLSQASGGLVDTTQAVGRHAEGVLAQVAGISRRAEQQSRKLEEQNQAITRMLQDLRRSADIATETARSTQETSAAASHGTETTRQALGRMRSAFERVEDSSNAVFRLSERTAEIHDIVEVITRIAQQTHLLSVNASIEAARAGDYGRGFAVVAEEIRRLADSSARSADRIRVIVQVIDDHTRQVVHTMRESTRELSEGRRDIDEISRTLDTIAEGTRREAGKVGDLSALTGNQLELAEHVVAAAVDVRQGAEHNAEATRNVESASSEQRSRSVDLERSSRQLAELAAELQSVASRFRL